MLNWPFFSFIFFSLFTCYVYCGPTTTRATIHNPPTTTSSRSNTSSLLINPFGKFFGSLLLSHLKSFSEITNWKGMKKIVLIKNDEKCYLIELTSWSFLILSQRSTFRSSEYGKLDTGGLSDSMKSFRKLPLIYSQYVLFEKLNGVNAYCWLPNML